MILVTVHIGIDADYEKICTRLDELGLSVVSRSKQSTPEKSYTVYGTISRTGGGKLLQLLTPSGGIDSIKFSKS
jgi:hypothetical protein